MRRSRACGQADEIELTDRYGWFIERLVPGLVECVHTVMLLASVAAPSSSRRRALGAGAGAGRRAVLWLPNELWFHILRHLRNLDFPSSCGMAN